MPNDNAGHAKTRMNWNPFQQMEGEAEALKAAKSGAIVGGYFALGYLLQAAVNYWGAKGVFGNTVIGVLVADVFGVLGGAFLAWRILVRQPLWATILAAVWIGIEIASKIDGIADGTERADTWVVVMFVALAGIAILSLRGSWTLRAIRRKWP